MRISDVGVVAVTFNSAAVAQYFSLAALNFRHVYIVDNASVDSTVSDYKKLLPQATIFVQSENLGFGAANNVGFAAAEAAGLQYVLFLNPDCKIGVADVERLKGILQAEKDVAIASPLMIERGEIRTIRSWDFTQPYQSKNPSYHQLSDLTGGRLENFCINGACFMVRTDLFREIGAFTEDIFLYCEEDDVNLRAARAGYRSILETVAKCEHLDGGSTPSSLRIAIRKSYNVRWSRFFMTDRYTSSGARILEVLRVLFTAPLILPLCVVTLNRKHAIRWLGWLAASLDGLFMTKIFRRLI